MTVDPPRTCAACGHANPPGSRFCNGCGAKLEASPAPAAAARFGAPGSYTPRHIAEKILTSRAALEGERKQVTVLFADLKGSMELLADRDPEEARKLLDPVLEHMMDAVHRYEGTVNQVMGDGIMALFGAPLAHEDHAVRACYAALRMQERVKRYAETVRRAHGVNVQIRIGLNSGDVVVRAIGSDLHMDYTAVGQTTHLAARMEQIADPGAIAITPDTLALAEGYIQVRPLGPITVKGLAQPLEIYELSGAGTARTRLQASRTRGLTRFVGRDAEMDQLRRVAEEARRARGQVVAVVGEPGVGKSRLFYEFIHSHHAHGWLTLESGSASYGKATAYLPVTDLLRGYLKIESRDDVRAIRAKVTGNLLTLDEALADAVPPVLWLLDALPEDSPFLTADPADRRRRTLAAVKRVLFRESQVQPLLLVFEDLHWVDSESQAFLDSLVESLAAVPVLLAVNYRPEYQHGWGNTTHYRQLRIDPLPPESAVDLLEALLGGDASVAPLKPLLIQRTQGNPLFVEESVRALVETGTLAGRPGAHRLVGGLESVRVPATVHALLAARIDRLSPEDKRVLQAAAVVGTDVPFALLHAVAELDEDRLRQSLARLQAAGLVYEARLFPELEYTFKHALTHEVAYGTVLQERRLAVHAAIVEAIERLYADRLVEQVELLAHHAVRGRVQEKAVKYLRQAGAKAVARSANREAVGFFEHALGLLDEAPPTPEILTEALDIRMALGAPLIAMTGAMSAEVEASYLRAQELVDRLGGSPHRFPVLWGLWYVNYTRGQYRAAREAGDRLLETARAGDDTGQLLEAHHALWPTLSAMGQPVEAVRHMEQGIVIYDRDRHAAQTYVYGGHDPGACCRYHLALNRWLLGQPDQALGAVHDALRLAEDLGHPQTTVISHWFAACVYYERGEREAMTASTERLLALSSAYGISGWTDVAVVLPHARTGARIERGVLAELRRQLEPIRAASWRKVFCRCVLAELYGEAGEPEDGRQLLASLAEEDRAAFYAPEVIRIEGELLLRRSPAAAEEAERSFRRAIELAGQRSEKSLELRAATSLARLWQHQGRPDEARRLLAGVYSWFTEGFETVDLRAAKRVLEEAP